MNPGGFHVCATVGFHYNQLNKITLTKHHTRNSEDRVYSCGSSLMHCLLWSPSRSFYIDELTTHVMVRGSHKWKQILSGKIQVIRKNIVLAYKNSRFKVASTAGSRSSGASSLLTTLKKGKAKGAAPPQHANKLTASPPCKLAKGKPQLEDKRSHFLDEPSEPKVRGRMTFGVKHAGKTATEILDQHGFAEIREAAEEVLATLCEPKFTRALLGENVIEFKESCTQLKKKIVVLLHNEIRGSSGASSLLTTPKKEKTKGAAPPQHANKLTASPPCKLAKGKPQLEDKRSHFLDEPSEPKVRGRMTFGVKHAGKTATEILDQHGFAEIREAAEEVLGTWCEPPFTTALLGENFIEFKESCTQLKKKACSIKWKIMYLRKKILKWKVIPDGVLQMATAWINKITAIHDSLGQFNLRSNQGGDTNMMKACMDCMASYSIDTPNAMKVVFFREKSSSLGDG